MKNRTDETRTSHGSNGPERGQGCCGEGIPAVFHHYESSSIMDDAMITSGPFGPPTEDEFGVAGQTEEEER